MEDAKASPDAREKEESFISRMRRRGVLSVQPPKPGELDVIEKLREMQKAEGRKA